VLAHVVDRSGILAVLLAATVRQFDQVLKTSDGVRSVFLITGYRLFGVAFYKARIAARFATGSFHSSP
jgi:hypothetical protein